MEIKTKNYNYGRLNITVKINGEYNPIKAVESITKIYDKYNIRNGKESL